MFGGSLALLIGFGLAMQFFLFGMWAVLYTYTPELYPTSARATGSGFASAVGRIGSLLGPLVTGLVLPLIGQGGVFTLGASVSASPPWWSGPSASRPAGAPWRSLPAEPARRRKTFVDTSGMRSGARWGTLGSFVRSRPPRRDVRSTAGPARPPRPQQRKSPVHGLHIPSRPALRVLVGARPTPYPARRPGLRPAAGGRPDPRPGGPLHRPLRRQPARPPARAALARRPDPQQGVPAPGADHALAAGAIRPAMDPGDAGQGRALPRQPGTGLHRAVPDPRPHSAAECPAGHLRAYRARPHPLDQGLRATGEDRRVRVRRDHHRLDHHRPLAAPAAVRPRRDVGGPPAGLQGHPDVLRRQRAAHQQRHAASRRLDRDAAGRRRRRRGGHHPVHREGAELRQDHRLGADLAPDVGVVQELARHAAVRRTADQAGDLRRLQPGAFPRREGRAAPEPGAPAHRIHGPQADRVAGVECRQRRGRPAGRQPPPADQHRYVPRLRPRLPAEPSGHPSAHDLHGPPVAADRPGHPAGDILLHPHHRLGRLRAHPGRRVRLPAGGDAGVRPRRLPAAQRPGPAPGAAGHARRA
ncbi:putative major facilitator superfamily transporter [Pseudomonas aeruginosa VRFPA02]|nr:putative major facilitator superfamily transporter [Pseudomonas aeruginosa VRFPA02]